MVVDTNDKRFSMHTSFSKFQSFLKYPLLFYSVYTGFPYCLDDQQLLWTAGLQVFTLVCNELFSALHTPEKKLTVATYKIMFNILLSMLVQKCLLRKYCRILVDHFFFITTIAYFDNRQSHCTYTRKIVGIQIAI
jgi:hypothetical protein